MILFSTHRGATLLITVLIVGSVALVVGMGIALRGIGELDAAVRTTESHRVLALAEGCVEKSLLGLWGDTSFARSEESFSLGDGQCTVKVDPMEDDHLRQMIVRADRGRYAKTIRVIVDVSGYQLEIVDWELL